MISQGFFKRISPYIILILILGIFLSISQFSLVHAQNGSVDELEQEVQDKESEIDQINNKIDEYRDVVDQYSQESASLMNDIALLENQVKLAELNVELTEAQIESQEAKVQQLEAQIAEEQQELDREKELLSQMIFNLHAKSDNGFIELFFGSQDFSQVFAEIQGFETLNEDLKATLIATQRTKQEMEENLVDKQLSLEELFELKSLLDTRVAQLESQQTAKTVLIEAAQDSEAKYKVLMSELRQERESINNELESLQDQINQKLLNLDFVDNPSSMTWPVSSGIITATFHDPTYPFRHLFEHSGIDIAVPTGTVVKSGASGIVIWARTGRSYGNYVMVLHGQDVVTLYAHLSVISVVEDQAVARGEQIGLSGNSGLSTGPHLHFETRFKGLPVNPTNYLVGSLD